MDSVLLARIQFAFTVGFHYIFPPLTIGMSWIIFHFMNRYRKTGDEQYAQHARFWTKLFAISFVVGVATGITMEFQSGTNWSEFSRFAGSMFGVALAAEGILAFFMESTFTGVLLFGWGKLSKRVLTLAAFLVAFGATASGLMIIVVNSWMQTPAGFEVDPQTQRAVMTDFWAAFFNPSTMPRFVHTIVGALATGAFFIMGVSAYYLLKGRYMSFAKRSLKVSLLVALVASIAQPLTGHWHGHQVWQTQPIKMAAYEGLFESEANPMLLAFGFIDKEGRTVHLPIGVPNFLSIFLDFNPDTVIQGLNEFPEEDWPPLALTFYPFHLMSLLGFYSIGLTILGIYLLWRRKLHQNRLFLRLALLSIPVPFIANELGWIAAEVGRQPWVVYGLNSMRTALVASPTVSAGEILFSLVMFSLLYLLMFLLWIFLLGRTIRKGPFEERAGMQAMEGGLGEEVAP
ncbi:MAG: cytochrome ubiquinol oxidase subunit I [Acidobacteria bacterium]|nr:cytochrome ubiquinol oxidase subunit I [Acidobacteriota bacterium]